MCDVSSTGFPVFVMPEGCPPAGLCLPVFGARVAYLGCIGAALFARQVRFLEAIWRERAGSVRAVRGSGRCGVGRCAVRGVGGVRKGAAASRLVRDLARRVERAGGRGGGVRTEARSGMRDELTDRVLRVQATGAGWL